MKETFLMTSPDLSKLDGNLYHAVGYSTDDDPIIEIKPSTSVYGDKVIRELKRIMGYYGNLPNRPYTYEPEEGLGLWNIEQGAPATSLGNPPLCYDHIGWWEGDWFLIGDYYDWDYRSEDEVELTFVCQWIISRDLYNELIKIKD